MRDRATAVSERRADGDRHGAQTELRALVRDAWQVGNTLDLGDAVYGHATRQGIEVVVNRPSTYYPFLAGLVRVTQTRLVIELGTNCGGSALAMRSGLKGAGEIITVDLSDRSDRYLRDATNVRKVMGDANSIEVIEAVVDMTGGRDVDIVFIDAAHSCMPTLMNYGLYGVLLNPRFIVIDDITLYPTMERMWRLVLKTRADQAINAAEVIPEIRPQKPSPGFGLVSFRPGAHTIAA
jgi:predicted O-methyltransferase YrrM